jgi:hypothetical protein
MDNLKKYYNINKVSEIQVLQQFKKQLISFFDELISQFPEEADLVLLRIFFNDQVQIKDVMEHFIHKLLTLRDMIKNRDETFFLEHNVLFQTLDKDKVSHFKKLWRSGRLDNDDKQVVWKWVDSFVVLADKYQKIKN